MKDVVVVLRERVMCSEFRKSGKPCTVVSCDCAEIERAAKEIERLREGVKKLETVHQQNLRRIDELSAALGEEKE